MTLTQILQKIRSAFYTKSETDNLLLGKSNTTHNHNSTYLGINAKASSASSADSVAWNNISGKPSSYTPSSHTHSELPYITVGTRGSGEGGEITLANGEHGSAVVIDNYYGMARIFGNDIGVHEFSAAGYSGTSQRAIYADNGVVESGTEGGAAYVRFGNGLQICTDSYYVGDTGGTPTGFALVFSKPFVTKPTVVVGHVGGNSSSFLGGTEVVTTASCSGFAWTTSPTTIPMIAIGKWK